MSVAQTKEPRNIKIKFSMAEPKKEVSETEKPRTKEKKKNVPNDILKKLKKVPSKGILKKNHTKDNKNDEASTSSGKKNKTGAKGEKQMQVSYREIATNYREFYSVTNLFPFINVNVNASNNHKFLEDVINT